MLARSLAPAGLGYRCAAVYSLSTATEMGPRWLTFSDLLAAHARTSPADVVCCRAEVAVALRAFAAADFWLICWAAFAGAVGFPARARVCAAGDVRLRDVVPVAFGIGAFTADADFCLTLRAVLRGALAALPGVIGAAATVRVVPYSWPSDASAS